ncbi:hypothetical protein HYPSUDRAFT_201666 [Hypholoma sublateritium FD-334 SS-4]|uniref:Cyanovirin-N domain-containing protein n=1 Tax=Hypholoma sublateritium (strain FD-334 SS-4) TaxID=945553 RepID=A0A0D2NWG6_HYPSF|nr:hypothetical protein HYPSUDRAFT_201666 [Hypholoma sublateritium FD-334 SS-4]
MPFSDSFRKASIKQGILTAECKKADQKTWISSSINLDDFLGNVDGKFVLGGKGFSQSAQDITLADAVISAKLKNSAGKYIDAKFDLSNYVSSKDGIIAAHGSVDVAGRPALAAIQATETSAAVSATSMSSVSSSHSTSTTSVQHSSHASRTFKSSSFRQFSQQLLLEEVCTNFVLKGTFLHCDVNHEDGRVTHVSFDLQICIGNVDGRLVWDSSAFHKSCKEIALDGFWLTAKCRHPVNHNEYILARLDLRTRLRLQGGVIIFVETNKKLSMMLSEVPWMKFKVIAEPDLSVFSKHPVVQQTMTRIAESTVEHVTMEMHKMLTIAMESAIVAVTASAMKHISTQMEYTVQDAVGYAVASPSATESEFLHIGAAAGMYGFGAGGVAYGSAHSAGGHAHYGGHYGATNGGAIQYSNGNGGGFYSAGAGSISRSASETSSISTSSSEQSQISMASTATATQQASAAYAAVAGA